MTPTHTDHEPAVPTILSAVTDDISRLVKQHFELAKLELQDASKKVARDGGLIAAGALFALLGYVLLAVSVAIGIGNHLGMARGFLVVSAFHVVVGGVVAMVFAKRLQKKDKPGLPATTQELARDKVFIQQVKHHVQHGDTTGGRP